MSRIPQSRKVDVKKWRVFSMENAHDAYQREQQQSLVAVSSRLSSRNMRLNSHSPLWVKPSPKLQWLSKKALCAVLWLSVNLSHTLDHWQSIRNHHSFNFKCISSLSNKSFVKIKILCRTPCCQMVPIFHRTSRSSFLLIQSSFRKHGNCCSNCIITTPNCSFIYSEELDAM